MQINEIIDIGVGYVRQGLQIIRNLLIKGFDWIGISGELGTMILMLVISLLLGYFLVKRFHLKPLASGYAIWYLLISLLIFLVLMYV